MSFSGKSEQLGAYIMELPFEQRKISTFFIYPSCLLEAVKDNNFSERERMIQLIERLTTEEGCQELQKLLDDGITQETDMLFPTFNIKQDLDMHRLLNMLGIGEFALSGTGQLHEFTSNSIRLGDAAHRVNVEMTKTGIIATASDVFFTKSSCELTMLHTNVDMCFFPCVCLIYDRSKRNILFCGILLES